MPSDAGTARELRDSPLFKAGALLGVLLVALLVSRSCGRTETPVPKEEAIEIAREQVDYEPDRVQVRFLKRGLQSSSFWAVSLTSFAADGTLADATVVVVDARTGDVAEVRDQSG